MADPDLEEQFERENRFCAWACVVGLLLAYALVLPLRWAGLLMPHASWFGIVVLLGSLFAAIGARFAFPLWLRERWRIGYVPFVLLCGAVMIATTYFELGR